MKSTAWAFLALGFIGLAATPVVAQGPGQERPRVQLERNYPNPFSTETTIPFTLSEDLWAAGRPVVTLRIYNVLAQLVAIPVLLGTGESADAIELDWNGTGRYAAYWDGRIRETNRAAASGVYVYQITVNGVSKSERMTVIK